MHNNIPTVRWTGEELYILDQTLIPVTIKEIKLSTEEEAYNAIKELKVRGVGGGVGINDFAVSV